LCPVAFSRLIAKQERERASAQVCILNGDIQQVFTMWRHNEDYVVYPQCVDTMSILIVSTQQVDAYRLVRGGPS
jgi:hypothetical protein